MGMLSEEFRRWRAGRGAIHRRPHHPRIRAIVRRGARHLDACRPDRSHPGPWKAPMTNPVLQALGRPFRLGIVGGAPPSMIGPVHRVAATMDQRFTLVAGMLSSRAERSRVEGLAIGLPGAGCFGRIRELLAA